MIVFPGLFVCPCHCYHWCDRCIYGKQRKGKIVERKSNACQLSRSTDHRYFDSNAYF
ncbi:hypothetical protein OK016_00710 [Vibrio chagasii]|nr:hypothetical protein [Vibrio chagasii]